MPKQEVERELVGKKSNPGRLSSSNYARCVYSGSGPPFQGEAQAKWSYQRQFFVFNRGLLDYLGAWSASSNGSLWGD